MVSFHWQTIEIKIKATVAVSRRLGLTREKSLRHVALVAKFLDDNKPKIHQKENFYAASNSIDLI